MRGLIRRVAIMMATAVGAGVLAAGAVAATTGLADPAAAAVTVTAVAAALPANAASSPNVTVASVSCASAGNCTAVGNYVDSSGNFQGLLLTETSGTWATGVEAVLPAGAASAQGVTLDSVSCASAGNCTAVGEYDDSSGSQQGLLLTETAGTWAAGTEAVLPSGAASSVFVTLRSVSCASAGNCSAVGSYPDTSGFTQGLLLTETSGTWAAGTEAVLPAGAASNPAVNVDSVSCAPSGDCAAVGDYADGSNHQQGLLLSETSGIWAAGTEAVLPAGAGSDPFTNVNSVSCALAGNCTAVGSYTDASGFSQGLLLSETSGAWAAGTEAVLPAGAGSDPLAGVASVSCASAGNCSAVGGYLDGSGNFQGLLLSETSGAWAAGTEAALPADAGSAPNASLSAVSCAPAGNCTAFGGYSDASGGQPGMLLTETSGTWATGVEVPLPAGAQSPSVVVPDSVSCAAPAGCSAVGVYADSTGHAEGLLVNQVSSACPGLTIASEAPAQTGRRGHAGHWSFTVRTRNCTGGTLHAMTVQGGSASWISAASATIRPSRGTVRIHISHQGAAITWRGFSLADLATASITVRVSGTVPRSAACGSSLPISGTWSASGQTAASTAVSSGPSGIATIKVTC